MKRLLVLAALALAASPALAEPPLTVQAVNAPLAYFAQRIGGDAVEVTMPVPPGQDPAAWKPGITELTALQGADLILLNGAEHAAWTQRVSLPRARTVDTSRAFAGDYIRVEGVTHSHGSEAEHTHAAVASATWLDFRQAGLQATAVAEALARARPAEAEAFADRLRPLLAELDRLDAEAADIGARFAGTRVLAFHPGYEYFARRYGLTLETLDWDATEPPTAGQLAALDASLSAGSARVMLWDRPPGPATAAALSTRGIEVVAFSLGATRSESFLELMAANLSALEAAAP
jgi:zinc transport system substrate-binding protein